MLLFSHTRVDVTLLRVETLELILTCASVSWSENAFILSSSVRVLGSQAW